MLVLPVFSEAIQNILMCHDPVNFEYRVRRCSLTFARL